MSENISVEMPKEDRDDFARLTAQESFSIEGQITKMEMIKAMIHHRFEARRKALKEELGRMTAMSEEMLEKALAASFQKIHVIPREIGDGRFNLIVEKGEDESEDNDPSIFRVMIPAHIDTVESGAPLQFDDKVKDLPDRITGCGVYDMAQGVLNNIALAVDVQVPKGMKAYFVFTVDEEMHSAGARWLIKNWKVFPYINCVLSSEIGHVEALPDDSNLMRIIAARPGRVKFLSKISIDPGSQGHGAEDDVPSAGDTLDELKSLFKERFYRGYKPHDDPDHEPPQKRVHALLPPEKIEDGEFFARRTRDGYMNTDDARWEFSVRMVPPSTVAEYLTHFTRWGNGIEKAKKWKAHGINVTLDHNESLPHAPKKKNDETSAEKQAVLGKFRASYSPYEMPVDHPFVLIASNVIHRFSGLLPEIVGAQSVADECDYAAALKGNASSFEGLDKGVITIPVNGDKAHNPEEWVSKRSIMRVRAVIRMLIEDPDGFRSLLKPS